MPILFQHRRVTSLIVSMAILLNLFAPALSQAVALRSADPLALEICSVTPNAAVNAAGGKRTPGGPHAHGVKHCMLCASHAGNDAPPPVAAGLLVVLDGHDVYPAPQRAVPLLQRHWATAQPRGPPAAA